MRNFREILSKYGISNTQFRIDLLSLFFNCKSSLTTVEILKKFNRNINKVTIYRALKSFESKGLIHLVPDKNNLRKYSLCNLDTYTPNTHNHQHAHFICYSCDQTFCLEDSKIENFISKSIHEVKNYNLVLEGFCSNCKA